MIRVSGPASEAALRALIPGKLPGDRVATLRNITHPTSGETLDRGLVVRFVAPRSFTGEDMVELQITGGRAVLNAVLGALATIPGLRPAEPGEFAWRAFANGKIDLSQVEGLADLVDAQTEAQRRQALRIAGGALSRQTETIRARLVQAMALIEAQIDFSDQEDVDSLSLAQVRRLMEEAANAITATLATAHSGELLREGFVVVIAGPPNVGKSTLMNALARRDVSIVSAIPGTTRDAIEVHLDLRGYPVTLVDTAGLRDTSDPIETEGISRARKRLEAADLMLWLTDGGTGEKAAQAANGPMLVVRTKIDLEATRAEGALRPLAGEGVRRSPQDGGGRRRALGEEHARPSPLPQAGDGEVIPLSAKTGAGIPDLLDAIAARAEAQFSGQGPALITLERHRLAFEEALQRLDACLARSDGALEFIAEDLRRAARALERIAGRVDVEEVLGEIFSRLCIGK